MFGVVIRNVGLKEKSVVEKDYNCRLAIKTIVELYFLPTVSKSVHGAW